MTYIDELREKYFEQANSIDTERWYRMMLLGDYSHADICHLLHERDEARRIAARAEAERLREGGFIPVQAGYIVGWTRMSDRAPTVDGLYDVWCDWCIRGVHPPIRAEWRYGEWNINGVTHWQPCPQGPEEVENERLD